MKNNILEKNNLRYAVVGSGSWATAIVKMLLNHQSNISWFLRDKKNIAHILKNHHNKVYLQSVLLEPERLKMSSDINEVVENSDVIVFCIPSVYFMSCINHLNVSLDNKFIRAYLSVFNDD